MQVSLDAADLALAGVIMFVALVSMVASACIRKFVYGIGRPMDRVKMPWRFSLGAIGVLTMVVAGVFALFRDLPCTAAVMGGLTLLGWTPFARFGEFRHILAERRKKALEAALAERHQASDARKGGPR